MVWVIWAESASRDTSPSLVLGYALLTSRAESALFLRMATGFGFAQVWRPHFSLGSVCMAICLVHTQCGCCAALMMLV